MAAPERFAEPSDSSCTAGAVHTWPMTTIGRSGLFVRSWRYRVGVLGSCRERSVTGVERECSAVEGMPQDDPKRSSNRGATVVLRMSMPRIEAGCSLRNS